MKSGPGQGALPRAGAGGYRQRSGAGALGGWERLDVQSRRRGSGMRPTRADPRLHEGAWCPGPGEVAGLDRAGLGRWAAPAARAWEVWAAGGPGRSASRPPSSRPRTSVSARRCAGHTRRSCRRLCRRRKPSPLPPPASGPVSSRLSCPPAVG
ncbi:uncharacterized protein LOC144337719 [Macaca mulatta]